MVGEFAGDLLCERNELLQIVWSKIAPTPAQYASILRVFPEWNRNRGMQDAFKEIGSAYNCASVDLHKLVEWSTADPITGRFSLCLSPLLQKLYGNRIVLDEGQSIARFFGFGFTRIPEFNEEEELFVRQGGEV